MYDDSNVSASMVMMAAVFILIGIAFILLALAYNGSFFRATTPEDQGTTVNIGGDLSVPMTSAPGGGTNY